MQCPHEVVVLSWDKSGATIQDAASERKLLPRLLELLLSETLFPCSEMLGNLDDSALEELLESSSPLQVILRIPGHWNWAPKLVQTHSQIQKN